MLENLLSQKRSAILKKWSLLVLDTYPLDTSKFLKREKNRFANPVGYTLSQELEKIYEELLMGMDPARVTPSLDRILRIRAVQEFSPSQAVSFVYLLKKAVREEVGKEIKKNVLYQELLEFESRIDSLGLLAFDLFVACKEKIYEIRVNEVKNRAHRLLERANLLYELPNAEEDKKTESIDKTA